MTELLLTAIILRILWKAEESGEVAKFKAEQILKAMIYDVDFFISKFSAIPEERWCTELWYRGDACCANGHCGLKNSDNPTRESMALRQIFMHLPITRSGREISFDNENYSWKAVEVNDGLADQYQQPTPKQRILAALYDIKAIQQKETATKEKIVYVAVPVTITEQAKELVMS